MKDYKRAYRRYKQLINFKRRVKNWTKRNGVTCYWSPVETPHIVYQTREELRREIYAGQSHTFLKTTGNPCSCFICSEYNKYNRPKSQNIQKDIFIQIQDNV